MPAYIIATIEVTDPEKFEGSIAVRCRPLSKSTAAATLVPRRRRAGGGRRPAGPAHRSAGV